MTIPTTTDRVEFLKRQIHTLEWDISLINNKEILQRKQAQLKILRSELLGTGPEKNN